MNASEADGHYARVRALAAYDADDFLRIVSRGDDDAGPGYIHAVVGRLRVTSTWLARAQGLVMTTTVTTDNDDDGGRAVLTRSDIEELAAAFSPTGCLRDPLLRAVRVGQRHGSLEVSSLWDVQGVFGVLLETHKPAPTPYVVGLDERQAAKFLAVLGMAATWFDPSESAGRAARFRPSTSSGEPD